MFHGVDRFNWRSISVYIYPIVWNRCISYSCDIILFCIEMTNENKFSCWELVLFTFQNSTMISFVLFCLSALLFDNFHGLYETKKWFYIPSLLCWCVEVCNQLRHASVSDRTKSLHSSLGSKAEKRIAQLKMYLKP